MERADLKEAIRSMREVTHGTHPTVQRFEVLDSDHALCIEIWPVKDSAGQLNRWTKLIRQGSKWLIESISEGFTEI